MKAENERMRAEVVAKTAALTLAREQRSKYASFASKHGYVPT